MVPGLAGRPWDRCYPEEPVAQPAHRRPPEAHREGPAVPALRAARRGAAQGRRPGGGDPGRPRRPPDAPELPLGAHDAGPGAARHRRPGRRPARAGDGVLKGAPDNILAGRLLAECLEGRGTPRGRGRALPDDARALGRATSRSRRALETLEAAHPQQVRSARPRPPRRPSRWPKSTPRWSWRRRYERPASVVVRRLDEDEDLFEAPGPAEPAAHPAASRRARSSSWSAPTTRIAARSPVPMPVLLPEDVRAAVGACSGGRESEPLPLDPDAGPRLRRPWPSCTSTRDSPRRPSRCTGSSASGSRATSARRRALRRAGGPASGIRASRRRRRRRRRRPRRPATTPGRARRAAQALERTIARLRGAAGGAQEGVTRWPASRRR